MSEQQTTATVYSEEVFARKLAQRKERNMTWEQQDAASILRHRTFNESLNILAGRIIDQHGQSVAVNQPINEDEVAVNEAMINLMAFRHQKDHGLINYHLEQYLHDLSATPELRIASA